jgi:hypothetical protein
VNGYSARIDRGHTRWRHHHHPFGRRLFQVPQKGGFPGSGLSGEENILIRVLQKVKSELKLRVGLVLHVGGEVFVKK